MTMQRLEWIDRMRGLAILSVVVQHLTYSFSNEFVYHKIIGISNMGLFFFISGYLMVITCKWSGFKESVHFIFKKIRTLIIPLISWGILLPAFVFQNKWHTVSWESFVSEWKDPHLWFLLTLFGYSILFAIYRLVKVRLRCYNVVYGGGLFVVFQLALLLIWKMSGDFKLATLYWIYFTSGIIIAECKWERFLENKHLLSGSFVTLLLVVCFWSSGETSVKNILIKIVCTFSIILLVYNVCKNMHFYRYIDQFLQLCGRESIAIYAVHWLFLKMVITPVLLPQNELIGLGVTSIFAVLVSIVCIYIHRLVKMMPIVKMILFGEK